MLERMKRRGNGGSAGDESTFREFHPPTDYYCESLHPVDSQLCAFLAKRQEIAGDDPEFPGVERIAGWCRQYGLDQDMVRSFFSVLYHISRFHQRPVPTGFRRFVPVAKFLQVDGVVYAVTHMKQYRNVSMVYTEIAVENDDEDVGMPGGRVELCMGPAYTCCQYSGSGSGGEMQQGFMVTPPLPDDVSGLEFSLIVSPVPGPTGPRHVPLKAAKVSLK